MDTGGGGGRCLSKKLSPRGPSQKGLLVGLQEDRGAPDSYTSPVYGSHPYRQ